MIGLRRSCLAIACAAILSSAARADFADGGFEDPAPKAGGSHTYQPGFSFGGPSGTAWTVTGPIAVTTVSNTYSNTNSTFQSHTGAGWLDLTGTADDGSPGSVAQTVATAPGQIYTLSFWIGHYTGGPSTPADVPAVIGLSINNGPLQNFVNGNAGASDGGDINWSQYSTSFLATAASTSFMFINDQTTPSRVAGLDDITLAPFVAAVPGPLAGAGLPALLGTIGLMVAGRRRNRLAPA